MYPLGIYPGVGKCLCPLSKPRMGQWVAKECFIIVDPHPKLVIRDIYIYIYIYRASQVIYAVFARVISAPAYFAHPNF